MLLADLKEDMVVQLDNGFTCRTAGSTVISKDPENGLYFLCTHGRHYIDGQVDGKTIIGISRWGWDEKGIENPDPSIVPPEEAPKTWTCPLELKTLVSQVLWALYTGPNDPFNCRSLGFVEVSTGFHKELLRGTIAWLREVGLLGYQKGLMSEDGFMRGAGYHITDLGREWVHVNAPYAP